MRGKGLPQHRRPQDNIVSARKPQIGAIGRHAAPRVPAIVINRFFNPLRGIIPSSVLAYGDLRSGHAINLCRYRVKAIDSQSWDAIVNNNDEELHLNCGVQRPVGRYPY